MGIGCTRSVLAAAARLPLGEERLRVNVTRGHTQEDMDTALELLKTYGEAFFVLSGEDIGPMEANA